MNKPVKPSVQTTPAPASKFAKRWLAKWSRWLHIYLSLVSLAAIVFFGLTGFTLNHPDWFFSETTAQLSGNMEAQLLNLAQPPPADWDGNDYGHCIEKLSVAEQLRAVHRLSGRVTDFLCFEDECEVTFQGPGYAATARINRSSGNYTIDVTSNDLISKLNDLHKGRHTGPLWSLIIDSSAIVSAVVGLSGFVLVFFLKLNRVWRVSLALVGTILLVAVIWSIAS